MNAYEMVASFHDKNQIGGWTARTARLYRELLNEEVAELQDQITRHTVKPSEDTLVGLAQEAADLIYVALGVLAVAGFRPDQVSGVFREVHRANMSKEGKRLDGKVLAGEGYQPADVRGVLGLGERLPLVTGVRYLQERKIPRATAEWVLGVLRDGGYLKEGV
jgi:phosphoribosyl-ATP pyrophosphohydrolase